MKEHNIPVWVMEPVRGGKLASLDPENESKLKALRPEESIAAWAFRFLQSVPEVKVVLSGMSNMEQMQENIRTYGEDKPLNKKRDGCPYGNRRGYVKKNVVPCTACHYCVDHCTQGLDIPRLLEHYNEHAFTGGGFNRAHGSGGNPGGQTSGRMYRLQKLRGSLSQQIKISEVMADFVVPD